MATVDSHAPAGPAQVATVSFVASRAAPAGGFWIALAGGVALARVAQRQGARQGFGASIAAMLETVALMGPARFGVPLTQAITAPMLGRLEARGAPVVLQVLACGVVRLVHNAAATAFFIWVITGGLDAYAGGYDALAGRVGLDIDDADALAITGLSLLAWSVFASTIQVLVYRRGLRDWHEPEPRLAPAEPPQERPAHRGRYDPRLVTLFAAVAFALLLVSTAWPVLIGVAIWLAIAWATARADPAPVRTGLVLTAFVAGGALVFTLVAGLSADVVARRTLRAGLLVLVATWLRAAAGADGLRDVSRRILGRLRRLPALPEAARTLDQIGSEERLVASARALADSLGKVEKRPMAIVDAVLRWVMAESAVT